MQRAVILMYVGAAAGFIASILGGRTAHLVLPANSATSPDSPVLDSSALHSVLLAGAIFGGCVAAGLWVWMAWKTGAGRSWARVLSTVFFAYSQRTRLARGYGAAMGYQGYLPPQYGYPGYGQPGYGQPPAQYGQPQTPR